MVSIVDAVPVAEKVSIRGLSFSVNGLPLEKFAELIVRSSAVAEFFSGGASPAAFLSGSAQLAAVVIGAGLGEENDAAYDAIRKLPAGDALKLLNVILRWTMPDGPGPLLETLALFEEYAPAVTASRTKAQATSSGKRQSASSGAAASSSAKS